MTVSPRTVLVFGAGGQVGRELIQRSPPAGFILHGLTHAEVDIADRVAVEAAVRRHQPNIIVNAAAYTAVDKAETERDRAFAVNETGPRNLASAASDSGAVLVHLSTDYVFDGGKTDPYVEDDRVAPASIYGQSKEAGERAVRGATPRHLILRTAWVYAAHGANFLKTMLRLAREREVIRVVADQHGTPTSAADLADAILDDLAAPAGECGLRYISPDQCRPYHLAWFRRSDLRGRCPARQPSAATGSNQHGGLSHAGAPPRHVGARLREDRE